MRHSFRSVTTTTTTHKIIHSVYTYTPHLPTAPHIIIPPAALFTLSKRPKRPTDRNDRSKLNDRSKRNDRPIVTPRPIDSIMLASALSSKLAFSAVVASKATKATRSTAVVTKVNK